MQNKNGSLLFSPTDLIRFMESPFASWMERLRVQVPALATPDPLTEDASTLPNSIKELGPAQHLPPNRIQRLQLLKTEGLERLIIREFLLGS